MRRTWIRIELTPGEYWRTALFPLMDRYEIDESSRLSDVLVLVDDPVEAEVLAELASTLGNPSVAELIGGTHD